MNALQKLLNIKLFGWLIVGLVGFIFARSIINNWENVQDLNIQPDGFIVLALLFFVLSVVASGVAWGNIVRVLTKHKVSNKEAVRVHLASWLLKYIPGQAGSLINKVAWAKKNNIDGKKITASFIYENVYLLLASLLIAVPILFVSASSAFIDGLSLLIPVIIVLPLTLLVLTRSCFSWLLSKLFALLKKQPIYKHDLLSTKNNILFLFKFLLPRIVNGAAFVFIVASVAGINPGEYIVFGAIYILAGIVGLLALFVPSGLGVREGVIVLFASLYMPTEQAIALALIARFYATLADIFVALLYIYLKKAKT